MTTRAQKVRLGVFMTIAAILLFGGVATLAGLKLWNPKDRYKVRFEESVSGLTEGSPVKMTGVRVGQVEEISISPKDPNKVVVTLALDPGTPIKNDTEAVIAAIGITGLKFIELTGGSKQAELLKPNKKESWIPAASSALHTLTGKATDIATKMEAVLNNVLPLTGDANRTRVRQLLENLVELTEAWTKVAEGAPTRVKKILDNTQQSTAAIERAANSLGRVATESAPRIATTLAAAQGAAQSLQRIMRGLKPQETLEEISETARAVRRRIGGPEITSAVQSLTTAARKFALLSGSLETMVRRRDRQISGIFSQLEETARQLKAFAETIKRRPSLLLRGEAYKERNIP